MPFKGKKTFLIASLIACGDIASGSKVDIYGPGLKLLCEVEMPGLDWFSNVGCELKFLYKKHVCFKVDRFDPRGFFINFWVHGWREES